MTIRPGQPFQDIAEARKWFNSSLFNLLVDYYPEVAFAPMDRAQRARTFSPSCATCNWAASSSMPRAIAA